MKYIHLGIRYKYDYDYPIMKTVELLGAFTTEGNPKCRRFCFDPNERVVTKVNIDLVPVPDELYETIVSGEPVYVLLSHDFFHPDCLGIYVRSSENYGIKKSKEELLAWLSLDPTISPDIFDYDSKEFIRVSEFYKRFHYGREPEDGYITAKITFNGRE